LENISLPKASFFNYPSVLEKASLIIAELKKALALKHLAEELKESLQGEVCALRRKQARLEAEHAAYRKQSNEEKQEMEAQLKKLKAVMAGYREFLLQPEIHPQHQAFVERKRAEQLQRRQEAERQLQQQEAQERARQQAQSAHGMRMR
jgi:chromosome segregation ATPase